MNTTHLGPRCLSAEPGTKQEAWEQLSRFCWSMSPHPQGKLIVFVHGFGGDAITTWEQFISSWPAEYAGYDLALFGYPSYKYNVDENCVSLKKFISLLANSPANTINKTVEHLLEYMPTLERPSDFVFSEIVFIAHSLGAVICRMAFKREPYSSWVRKSKLMLFAQLTKVHTLLCFSTP